MIFKKKKRKRNMVKRKITLKLDEEMMREHLIVLNKFKSPDLGKLFSGNWGTLQV